MFNRSKGEPKSFNERPKLFTLAGMQESQIFVIDKSVSLNGIVSHLSPDTTTHCMIHSLTAKFYNGFSSLVMLIHVLLQLLVLMMVTCLEISM